MAIEEAIMTLCGTTQTIIGLFVMLALLGGIISHMLNHVLNGKKPEEKRKSLLGKLGMAALALCIVLFVLYLVTPVIIPKQCNPTVPPYCGQDYCYHKNATQPAENNCTCIQY